MLTLCIGIKTIHKTYFSLAQGHRNREPSEDWPQNTRKLGLFIYQIQLSLPQGYIVGVSSHEQNGW